MLCHDVTCCAVPHSAVLCCAAFRFAYWESVVMLRKLVVAVVVVFMNGYDTGLQVRAVLSGGACCGMRGCTVSVAAMSVHWCTISSDVRFFGCCVALGTIAVCSCHAQPRGACACLRQHASTPTPTDVVAPRIPLCRPLFTVTGCHPGAYVVARGWS